MENRSNYHKGYRRKKPGGSSYYQRKEEPTDYYSQLQYKESQDYKQKEKKSEQKKQPSKKNKNKRNKNQRKNRYKRKESGNFLPVDPCLVCLNAIKGRSKTWVCKECHVTTHLNCIKDWVDLRNRNQGLEGSDAHNFTCPHCNFEYKNEIPRHTCYCRKIIDPPFNHYNEPNSCGQVCEKFRGRFCRHPCPRICHTGKCDPCDRESVLRCYCGRKMLAVKCGENISSSLSCKDVCGKELNCREHSCERNCHEGECVDCKIKTKKECYCGKEQKTINCGDDFSCKKKCGKKLDCGNHVCEKECHEGSCGDCPSAVKDSETCYCGKYEVTELFYRERDDCSEEIPSCKKICSQPLPCGDKCNKICHTGECDCGKTVTRTCRCGLETFETKCKDIEIPLCKNKCKKNKNCQKHNCNMECCPGRLIKKNYPPHMCNQLCEEPLECGKHDCTKRCHNGKCSPCDILESRAITCACGFEVLRPPQLCGTESPTCHRRCNKELDCGHRCYFNCHFGECGKCEEILDKKCACGKETIKNVKCFKTPVCQNLCKTELVCEHICQLPCHDVNNCYKIRDKKRKGFLEDKSRQETEKNFFKEHDLIDKSCFGKCGKSRESCGHPCLAYCHTDKDCPPLYCMYMTTATCSCGNKQKYVECGSIKENKLDILECDDKCKNIQRFKDLYKASGDDSKLYYSDSLVNFGKEHPKLVKRVEKVVKEMFFKAERVVSFTLKKSEQQKLDFYVQLLKKHYFLDVSFYKTDKQLCVDAFKTTEFILPKVPLSDYINKLNKKKLKQKNKPFDVLIKFHNLSVFDKPENLDEHLQDLKDMYYLEKNQGVTSLCVWEGKNLEVVKERLKEMNNNWSSFFIEYRNKEGLINKEEMIQGKKVIRKKEKSEESEESEEEDFEDFGGGEFKMPVDIILPKKYNKQKTENKNIFDVFGSNI